MSAARKILFVLVTIATGLLRAEPGARAEETVWTFGSIGSVGGNAVDIIGSPKAGDGFVEFDGVQDGLLVRDLPLAGAEAFTIEIGFMPVDGGGPAQRFLHAEDANGTRALIELRTNGQGSWWLDTHIKEGGNPARRGTTLIDPERKHPTGRWFWAALRFDGTTLAHFVDGELEREERTTFVPFASGSVSIGVRQNRVSWFRGAVREVRFSRVALPVQELKRSK